MLLDHCLQEWKRWRQLWAHRYNTYIYKKLRLKSTWKLTAYACLPGVDGHTVLRYVSDIYTDTILRFAKTINSQTKSIFHSQTYKKDDANTRRGSSTSSTSTAFDTNPRRIEWNMTDEIALGVRFAETRLSDLILQNEVKVLEFNKYGKYFITDMKMSPDAFVQVRPGKTYKRMHKTLQRLTILSCFPRSRWPIRQLTMVFMASRSAHTNLVMPTHAPHFASRTMIANVLHW